MKISYNWLKNYINIDKSPEELSDILTNTGLEVEKLNTFESIKGGLNGLVVGKVLSKEKHPNAEKLSITTVDVGAEKPLSIVCGAPNVATGQKVVVATIGTILYSGNESFKIKKSKLRGEISEGMICSASEIGVGTAHDGIMVLDNAIAEGTPAKAIFEVEEDYIFEIGLTPNRADAMSHIGTARDVAAALNVFNAEKTNYFFPKWEMPTKVDSDKKIDIKVEDSNKCPRYSGVLIDNIEVKESPLWLQNRLKAVGVNPINNVVDITNFVLKEYGQALHAFDYEAIKGNTIIVKTLAEGTKFTCLDGKEVELSQEDLMICNAEEGMCIAGVFGGENSGVKDTTQTIFLESAFFDSKSIRKTSTTHHLKTDAAGRYEKGADPALCIIALQRATALICELAGGQIISDIQDIYPKKVEPFTVDFRYSRLNLLAGKIFEKEVVQQILSDLEIKILSEKDDALQLEVPRYRADVQREIDVIEEVLRIYGFNNIETPLVVHSTLSFRKGIDKENLKNTLSEKLNGLGFSEIMTNSISKSEFYSEAEQKNLVKLQNSMTAELDIMRSTLLFDGLEVLAHNINRKMPNLDFYEFGSKYNADYSQDEKLVLYKTGLAQAQNWKQKASKSNFYHLMGSVSAVLKDLKIKNYEVKEIENDWFDYGVEIINNQKQIGIVGCVASEILAKQDIKQEVFYAEMNWDILVKQRQRSKIVFESIPKFPAVKRDLALIIDEEISFAQLQQQIQKAGGKYLTKLELFDIYRNEEKVGKNKKSYAISLTLLNKEKTLVDKEIDKIINKIVRQLQNQLNATIRG